MTPERLRIALVRARYSPFGGAERFAQRALTALAGGAVDVTIIARRWMGAGEQEAGAPVLRWLRCDPFYLGSLWRDWSFARGVRQLLAHERFDLIQSHERIAGLDIYRAGDGVHAVWLERRAAAGGWRTRLALAFNLHHHYLLAAERALFEDARLRAVICNSTMVRNEILARFRIQESKLHLIPNSVDLARFNPALRGMHRVHARAALGIPEHAITFLFVGSGFARKGLAAAIAALPDACHLIVVGSDKHAKRYAQAAVAAGCGARVHFVGEQQDTLAYYGAADAFVLPTLYDPFPNAVLEALASGLPVVTSDACGARELIVRGRNGWVVPSGNRGELERALSDCAAALGVDATRQALMRAARDCVQDLGSEKLAFALIQLYRSVLPPETGARL